jgi:hypothetical protein
VIKAIIDECSGVTSKGLRAIPKKYIPFPDKHFGVWADDDNIYIGNKSNKVLVDGNDLIINDEMMEAFNKTK